MRNIFVFIFILVVSVGFSQTNRVPYSRDYEFTQGLFLTVHQFKGNSPIAKSSIISEISQDDVDFLKQQVQLKNIRYMDSSKYEHKIETSSLWGYCQNRTVYINYNNDFNRVNVIGTLMQFTALVTTSPGFMDPMYSNYGLNTTVDELRQFVFDTQTNKILPFDVKSLTLLLKSDPELYAQYMALGKREKTDSQFIYLRKYNESHPLMLPSH